jgi:hypothetical protein
MLDFSHGGSKWESPVSQSMLVCGTCLFLPNGTVYGVLR